MKIYEIRVMTGHRSGPDIYSGTHLNDHAAVRRAMMLVKPSQWIEVWCGARCVYAGSPRAGSSHAGSHVSRPATHCDQALSQSAQPGD
jgi:hypothetical protein